MAAAGDEKHAAAALVPEQEEEKELVSGARDVADDTAVVDEAAAGGGSGGFGRQERVEAMIRRAIARKVAMLESGERVVQPRELQMLRGIVVGGLTEPNTVMPRRKKEKDGEAVVAMSAPAQQQEEKMDADAGCNKIIGGVDD